MSYFYQRPYEMPRRMSGGIPSPLRGGLGRRVRRRRMFRWICKEREIDAQCFRIWLISMLRTPLPNPPRKGEGNLLNPTSQSIGPLVFGISGAAGIPSPALRERVPSACEAGEGSLPDSRP
jgi:hypothetical protein